MTQALCPRCGRRWSGLAQCHCPTCHRHFGDVKAFDRHRRDDACLDPATVKRRDGQPAFEQTIRPSGPVWHVWSPTPHWKAKSPTAARSGHGTRHLALTAITDGRQVDVLLLPRGPGDPIVGIGPDYEDDDQ